MKRFSWIVLVCLFSVRCLSLNAQPTYQLVGKDKLSRMAQKKSNKQIFRYAYPFNIELGKIIRELNKGAREGIVPQDKLTEFVYYHPALKERWGVTIGEPGVQVVMKDFFRNHGYYLVSEKSFSRSNGLILEIQDSLNVKMKLPEYFGFENRVITRPIYVVENYDTSSNARHSNMCKMGRRPLIVLNHELFFEKPKVQQEAIIKEEILENYVKCHFLQSGRISSLSRDIGYGESNSIRAESSNITNLVGGYYNLLSDRSLENLSSYMELFFTKALSEDYKRFTLEETDTGYEYLYYGVCRAIGKVCPELSREGIGRFLKVLFKDVPVHDAALMKKVFEEKMASHVRKVVGSIDQTDLDIFFESLEKEHKLLVRYILDPTPWNLLNLQERSRFASILSWFGRLALLVIIIAVLVYSFKRVTRQGKRKRKSGKKRKPEKETRRRRR